MCPHEPGRIFLKSLLGAAVGTSARPLCSPPSAAPNVPLWETRSLRSMRVSCIGLGCVDSCPVGYYGQLNEKADILRLIRQAADAGAPLSIPLEIYGMRVSEAWLGEALHPIRNQVNLETKFGFAVEEGTGTLNSQPDHLRRAVEGSLKRLRTDHIDLLFQHRVDPATPIETVAETVGKLIREGKVLRWGLSEASASTIRRAHAVQPLSAVESEYAIWWREPETKIFPTLQALGIGFVAYAPIGRGYLTGRFSPESRFTLLDRRAVLPRFTPEALKHNEPFLSLVRQWAARKNLSPAQFSLAWILSRHPWIVPIPGTTNPTHLRELLGAKNARLTPEERHAFDTACTRIPLMGHRTNAAIEAQLDHS